MTLLAYIRWVTSHRRAVGLVVALLSVASCASLSRAVLSTSVLELFFGDSPAYRAYEARSAEFGESERCLIAFEEPALGMADGWDRMEQVTQALESVGGVARVESLTRAQTVWAQDDDLFIESYEKTWREGTTDPTTSIEQAFRAPELSGVFVSEIGPSTLLSVEFEQGATSTTEAMTKLNDELLAAVSGAGVDPSSIKTAGLLPESVETTGQTRRTLLLVAPLTFALLLLCVFALFGQLWPVWITSGTAVLSMLWTFGLAVQVEPKVNLLMALVPAVTLVIAFADVIHLCSAYVTELERGSTKEEAILGSASAVGKACLFTSMTTFLGFAALSFVPTPALRQLGLLLGIGVAIALLTALTLTPVALSMLPAPSRGLGRGQVVRRSLSAVQTICQRLAQRRPWGVITACAALCAVCLMGVSGTRVEASLSHRLAEDNPIRQSHDFIRERFSGAYFLDFYVDLAPGSSFDEPMRYDALRTMQATIDGDPAVRQTLSFIDLVQPVHEALNPGQTASPNQAGAIPQYLTLFEVAGGVGGERLLSADRRTARILAQVTPSGFVEASEVGLRAIKNAKEILPSDMHLEPTGLVWLLGRWILELFRGNLEGLAFAFLTTTLVMVFGLRLGAAGLVAMLPNAMPIVLMVGVLCWGFEEFDPEAILVGMIAVGLAVDDTIHFLVRLRFERGRSASMVDAMDQTFRFAGSSIVKTTIVLCAGLLPFAATDYLTTRLLGTLLPTTLVGALAADLLLLPALVYAGFLTIPARSSMPDASSVPSASLAVGRESSPN